MGQGKVVPTFDLMGFDDCMRGIVDWAPEADADADESAAVDARLGQQLRDRRSDLPTNSVRPGRDLHRSSPKSQQRAIAEPNAKLQFGAADFDAEVHKPPLQRNPRM